MVPQRGLLGAAAPRPAGRPAADQIGCANLSNRHFVCQGFELRAPNTRRRIASVIRDFRGMVPQRGLLGAARLALRVGVRAIKLAAPICRTGILSVRGSNCGRESGPRASAILESGMVPQRGFEPLTDALRMRCSTN